MHSYFSKIDILFSLPNVNVLQNQDQSAHIHYLYYRHCQSWSLQAKKLAICDFIEKFVLMLSELLLTENYSLNVHKSQNYY